MFTSPQALSDDLEMLAAMVEDLQSEVERMADRVSDLEGIETLDVSDLCRDIVDILSQYI